MGRDTKQGVTSEGWEDGSVGLALLDLAASSLSGVGVRVSSESRVCPQVGDI